MNQINFFIATAWIISLLVLLQGWSILWGAASIKEKRKREIRRIVGLLTVLMAILGTIINSLFLSADIAISPEFGVFIIQGNWPTAFFAFCLLGLIFCVSLGWDLARLREQWKTRRIHLYGSAFLVGLVSILILPKNINAFGANEAPVYLYDIWWPPLLLWMAVAFTDIALTILKVRDGVVRGLAAVGMIIPMLLAAAYLSPLPDFAHPWTRMSWAIAAALLLFPIWYEVSQPSRALKPKAEKPREAAIVSHLKQNSIQAYRKFKKQQGYTLLSLALIVIGIAILFNSPRFLGLFLGTAPGIIVILVGWGFITEIITDGWFHDLYGDYKSGRWFAKDGSFDKASTTLRNGIKDTGERLGKIFSLPTHWTAIIKLLIVVLLLTALNETQNRGRTIIQPFQAIGFEDSVALMSSADDRLINNLSILNQQLQPILMFPTSSGIFKKRIDYVQAGNIPSIDAALNNSVNFELGTVKLPANVLVSPVQGLVRPWLKVRMVNGSMISNGNRYVLLVTASDGGTWIAQTTVKPVLNLQQDLPGLVEEMAFLMLSSEESLQDYGLTRNWQAYQAFQTGVENIQSYESKHNYDALGAAIQNFRTATLQDPNFALAYYRLGLALQQNRQPWQAEDALRMGLALNPESIPLKNALAYHLYFFDSYTPLYPAVLHAAEKLSNETKEGKKDRARRLWSQIVTLPNSQVLPPDRASAYLGLCNAALDHRERYLAYFYCFKSHTLLERLPRDQQSHDKIRQADASALNNLGVIVYGMGFSTDRSLQGWNCEGRDPVTKERKFFYHPGYADAALKYYEKALVLQPQDSVIRCNAAIVASLRGRDGRMRELEQSAQAHYVLGSKYLDQARREPQKKEPQDGASPSPYYREALLEYLRAIDLNPTYHEALNRFAYTFWLFRLRWPEVSPDTLGINHLDALPEYYADKALRLAILQKNDYLEMIYAGTKAEVLMAKGDFQGARKILVALEGKMPDSYVLDEIRWDLAQNSLCLLEQGTEDADLEELKEEARRNLQAIVTHEAALETYVFSFTGNQYLTEYRLPCDQFLSAKK